LELSSITAKFGVVLAVVISSAVFELLHFDSRANWIFVTYFSLRCSPAAGSSAPAMSGVSWVGTADGIGCWQLGSSCA
jgi:hypothetical protein